MSNIIVISIIGIIGLLIVLFFIFVPIGLWISPWPQMLKSAFST